jgi:hypothetical protein
MRTTIISAADAGAFAFLQDLIRSFHAAGGPQHADFCVLDVGLTPAQRQSISPEVRRIVSAKWDYPFDHARVPPWFRAMTARPHLPRYFNEYEILVWVDADAWFCNWDAASLLIRAAAGCEFVGVPELDRTYAHCYQLRPVVQANLERCYREGYGEEAARRFASVPVVNAGVFAMRRDSPGWRVWDDLLGPALLRSTSKLVEQCALNIALYTGRIRPHFLPSWCNWNCGAATPLLNPVTRQLLVPMLPFEPISICHLIDVKDGPVEVNGTDGKTRKIPLTYRSIRHSGELPT